LKKQAGSGKKERTIKKIFLIFAAAVVLSSVAFADYDDTPDDSILSYYDTNNIPTGLDLPEEYLRR
jgi:hypothetical protein